MDSRASEPIELLDLEPYPEGGHFRLIYTSANLFHLPDSREERKAMTTIYYMLVDGGHETWHRVRQDEVWHYHEGAPLELNWTDPGVKECTRRLLGEVGESKCPIAVVPGGCWQMTRKMGAYTLVGCTVGPGFEYEDYTIMRDLPAEARELRRRFPELAEFR